MKMKLFKVQLAMRVDCQPEFKEVSWDNQLNRL